MHVATVRPRSSRPGATHAAVGDDRGWVVLDHADVHALLAQTGWRDEAISILAARSDRVADADLDFLTPLPRPAKVLCCGLNYRDHIVETGRELPTHPTLFAKFADTLTGPTDTITVAGSTRVDWEAELAVVIGAEIREVDERAAADAILGYTVANDISMRDWQQRTLQWLQGKAFDASTPLGPHIVTADEVDPKAGLAIECAVNDRVVQRDDTAQLVFDAAQLVSYVSRFTRLSPGDILLTGTPGGVGMGMPTPTYLRDGDVVSTRIEGIGELRNSIRILPG